MATRRVRGDLIVIICLGICHLKRLAVTNRHGLAVEEWPKLLLHEFLQYTRDIRSPLPACADFLQALHYQLLFV
jgi:hypothetical protein